VSGADDGSFKIWDLKNFRADAPVAHFKWHRAQITGTKHISLLIVCCCIGLYYVFGLAGVQWHPHEESTLAVASADDSISIWDMSLEPDNEVPAVGAELEDDIPPQLLFVHQGQQEVKEVHFHPQISSMLFSTAADGFNVFQPSNL
jgi:ribosome assembly protein RRB1